MAGDHSICRQRALTGLLLLCVGILAAGLLVPAAGAGSVDADYATNASDDADLETTEVVLDLSSWVDDRAISVTLELPSVAVSWLEAVFTGLVESPELGDDEADEPTDQSDERDGDEPADADGDGDGSDDGDPGEDEPRDDAGGGDSADEPESDESDGDSADDDGDEADAGDGTDEDGDDGADDDSGDGADEDSDEDAGDADDEDDQRSHATAVEHAIHDEINEVRADHGLEALAFDDDLADVARAHSEDMADRDYFSHTTPEGETVGDRYAAAGISCQAWGENILYNGHGEESPAVIAERSVAQWMDSDGHRENILSERWDSEGIGVAIDDGELYATQNFGTDCN
ncbi:CAP domain-containing protein [Natrononativus amylolyticus]|uniref:CAP domain-containing protein n=1 Tax=Natrononativus amylolyticus TaxID=2963434 RepID=UPI0020CF8743|nr:CAP domain-containing protein [Natrononativus amylolyticus]